MTGFMMRWFVIAGIVGGFLWGESSDAQAQIGLKASYAGRAPRHAILNDETYEWYLRDADRYWEEQRRWLEEEYHPYVTEIYESRYYGALQPLSIETKRYPAAAIDYHDFYTNRNVVGRASGYRYPASGIAPPPPRFAEWRTPYSQWR